ncbi:MAG TPA: alpha/beta hydrolase [Anaerolineales bacterium]
MIKPILFIHGGGGEGAYEEDGILAASLQKALGSAYEVRYPKMPLEENAGYSDWKAPIAMELSALDEAAILVAHSVGGSILLKYLSEEQVENPIAGLFLLATPYFGGDENWNYPEMNLSQDFATKLPAIPRIFLYHSRDDDVVPFAHLALYAAKLPRAIVRIFDGRGHQFGNDLADIAEDITGDETRSGW